MNKYEALQTHRKEVLGGTKNNNKKTPPLPNTTHTQRKTNKQNQAKLNRNQTTSRQPTKQPKSILVSEFNLNIEKEPFFNLSSNANKINNL